MILVDSSIWIEHWRTENNSFSARLCKLIESDQASINGLIYHECVQGSRNEHDLHKLERLLKSVPLLPLSENIWVDSARFSFKMKIKGINITTVDCILATQAIKINIPLFSKDGIFEKIARQSDLKLY